MVFATSALIAQIGISAQLALPTRALSTPVTASYQFMSLSTILRHCLDHTAARPATTVSTAMVLYATLGTVRSLTSKETDTSAQFAMTPTSVPAVKQVPQTHITEPIPSSNSRHPCAMSASQPWVIMRMVNVCQ